MDRNLSIFIFIITALIMIRLGYLNEDNFIYYIGVLLILLELLFGDLI